MRIHVVQKGDSLGKIAQKYQVDHETLKNMNSQLTSPESLKPGMKVKIPTEGVPVRKSKGFKAGAKKEKILPKMEKAPEKLEKAPIKMEKTMPIEEKPFKEEKKAIEGAQLKKTMPETKSLKKEPYKPVAEKGDGKPRPNPGSGMGSGTGTGQQSGMGTSPTLQDTTSTPGGWSFHYPPSQFDSLSPASLQGEAPQQSVNPQMVSPAGYGGGYPNANMFPQMYPQMVSPAGYGPGPSANMLQPMMMPPTGYGSPAPQMVSPASYGTSPNTNMMLSPAGYGISQVPSPAGLGPQVTSPESTGPTGATPSGMVQPASPLPGEFGQQYGAPNVNALPPFAASPATYGPNAGGMYPQSAVSPSWYGAGTPSALQPTMTSPINQNYANQGWPSSVTSPSYYGAPVNTSPQMVSPMMTQPSGSKCSCGDSYRGYYPQSGAPGYQSEMGTYREQYAPSYWEPGIPGGYYGMIPADEEYEEFE